MNKYLMSISFVLAVFISQAQNVGRITVSPSTYTVEDEITIRIDLTGTRMDGVSEAYLWIFGAQGDGVTNGAWTNSNEIAKFTRISGNIWEYKFIPVVMWPNSNPGSLTKFSFLVKNKNGSLQTDNAPEFTFESLIFVETTYRFFPERIGQDDIVTLYFNQNLATELTEQRMDPKTVEITAIDTSAKGNVIGAVLTANLKNEGGKRYSYTFIPLQAFGTAPGGISKLKFTVKGNGKNESGNTIVLTSPEQEKLLLDIK